MGMLLPAQDQGRHFRRQTFHLRSQAVSLLGLQPTNHDPVDQKLRLNRSTSFPPIAAWALRTVG